MNNHAKRLCTHLETLDFRRDYDAEEVSKARRIYRHANNPGQAIKVHDQMSDNTITTARKLADKIVGLGSNGPAALTIKERAQVHRRKQTQQQKRDDEARRVRAEAAEAEHAKRTAAAQIDAKRREIQSLMMPGGGR